MQLQMTHAATVCATQGFSDESSSIGAMTDSFIKAVEAEPGTTYGRLLSAMRTRIRDGQGSRRLPGRLGSFVRWMIPSSSVQVSWLVCLAL
jgi:metacaspase-1